VRILKNPDEVALGQTFAVATEEGAGSGARFAGADGVTAIGADSASDQIKRFFASEAQTADTNSVAGGGRRFASRLGGTRQLELSLGWRHCDGWTRTASFTIAIASPTTPAAAARAFAGFGLFNRGDSGGLSLEGFLAGG